MHKREGRYQIWDDAICMVQFVCFLAYALFIAAEYVRINSVEAVSIGSNDVDIYYEDDYLMCTVIINGNREKMLIDTGSPQTKIDLPSGTVRNYKRILIEDGRTMFSLSTITIGTVAYRTDDLYSINLSAIIKYFKDNKYSPPIGIIGNDILRKNFSSIDFANMKLRKK